MRGELKPYPAYKDSGVGWMGEVPEHWAIAALRHRYSQCLGKMLDSKRMTGLQLIPYLRNTDVQWDRIRTDDLPTMDISPAEYGRYTVQHGDLLVCEGGEVGRCAIWSGKVHLCGFQKALHRLRPLNSTSDMPRFAYYALRAAAQNQAFNDGHLSTIAHLTGDKLRAQRLPFPHLAEQALIVKFLDHADRRIRRYIRAKQKLIKLVEEQKQAIIHRAVTRGLDPNVRLKDSGVEWLGGIPAHWEVRKLRQCGGIVGGSTPSMADRSFWGGTIPWVTPKDMKRDVIDDSRERVTEEALKRTSLRMIPAGAVLLVVRGMILARKVPIARTSKPVTINQDMKAIVPRVDTVPAFLAYTMDSGQRAFAPLIDEAGHGTRRLPTERWRELSFAFPQPEEQERIAKHIESAVSDLVRAADCVNDQIALLREYRTRLIADLVTGKLDVREAAARLPDEREDAESLDEAEETSDTVGEENGVGEDDGGEGVPEESES